MATSTSVMSLYGALAALAYTETQMAKKPLNPFTSADISHLVAQSKAIANSAATLHDARAAALDQSAVDSATAHVKAAQSLFDIINGSPTSSLTAAGVFSVVDSAIAAANAAATAVSAAA